MNISEVAEIFSVTAVTLRYYERVGLIPPIERKSGGVRNYKESDLNWIEFIKCMRDAGLSIDSLNEYTTLYQKGNATLDARKLILMRERDILANKYKEMGKTLDKLNNKIDDYENGEFFDPKEQAF